MSRRKPTKVLQLSGAFRKNPNRARIDPDTEALKAPPKHLSDSQRQIWADIVRAAPKGVITEADRFSLEILCTLVDQFRTKPADMLAAKLVRLDVLLGKFGLTPSDRSKVAAPARKTDSGNPFADL